MKPLALFLFCGAIVGQTTADQVRQLPSPKQAAALSRGLLESSRQSTGQIAAMLTSSSDAERMKARAVLNELEELALPALASAKGLRAEDEVWRLRTMADVAIALRQLAAKAIDAQLENCSRVAADPRAVSEVAEPPRRVCDDAYLAMTELIGGRTVTARDLDFQQFLKAPEARRDARIRTARQSAAWRELTR